MATAYHHALSSANRFGGHVAHYIQIHEWLDASKAYLGDFRHRAMRHHTVGIQEAVEKFGTYILIGQGDQKKYIPVRLIAEQHVIEDCGYLPTVQDWLSRIQPEPWMNSPKKLSQELEEKE